MPLLKNTHFPPLPIEIVDKTELDHSLFIKRKDGIIEIRCAEDFTYEKEHLIENHTVLKSLFKNEKLRVLSFPGKFTSASYEARHYVARGPHKDFILCEAFLIHSLAQKMIGNFFMKVNKPIVPANYYSYNDKAIAEKWLLNFRNF